VDLQRANVLCTQTTILRMTDVEFDRLAVDKVLESIGFDFGEVDEQVISGFAADETVSLVLVEPLDSTFSHENLSFLPMTGKHAATHTSRSRPLHFGTAGAQNEAQFEKESHSTWNQHNMGVLRGL